MGQDYLPPGIGDPLYYVPGPFGFEKDMAKRLEYWRRLRNRAKDLRDGPEGKSEPET